MNGQINQIQKQIQAKQKKNELFDKWHQELGVGDSLGIKVKLDLHFTIYTNNSRLKIQRHIR